MPPVHTVTVSEPRRRSVVASFFIRMVKEKPLGMASAVIILLLILLALFGGEVSPYPYNEIHLIDMSCPISHLS